MTTSTISLQDVKTHLRFPNPSQPSSDDWELQLILDAATDVARFFCDDVVPTQYVSEKHNGGSFVLFTYHRPILSVEEVVESWGWMSRPLDQVEPDTETVKSIYAFAVDNYETGQISRRSAGGVGIPFVNAISEGIALTYTAGRASLPGPVKLGILEMAAHIYQNAEQRSVALAGANIAYDATAGASYSRDPSVESLAYSVPYRVQELWRAYRRMPVIA